MKGLDRWTPAVLVACLFLGWAGPGRAADEKRADEKKAGEKKADTGPLDRKQLDTILFNNLKDVIDRGAALYNSGDMNGCYRLWEGALMALRPLLEHRGRLQQSITTHLAMADRNPYMNQRAFVLREVLDQIRAEVNPNPRRAPGTDRGRLSGPKEGYRRDVESEPERKETKPKQKTEGKGSADTGTVTGKVTAKGKPVPGGEVVFRDKDDKDYKAELDKDGSYELKNLKPGEYTIWLRKKDPAATLVPEKYTDPKTSGLKHEVKSGEQTFDISLRP
jgi:hypothetical protein